MKKLILCLCVLLLMAAAVCGRGGSPSADFNLVVVNLSGTPIYAAQAGNEVSMRADGRPLQARKESLDVEVSGWPVEVTVYGDTACREPVASRTVDAVPEGADRWYISVRDGENGLELECSEIWPEK